MWDDKRILEDDFSDAYGDGSFEYGDGNDADIDSIVSKYSGIEL